MNTCDNEYKHFWVKGKLFIHSCVSSEEPIFYPPQGFVEVEYCSHCGLLRLPEAEKGV